MKRTGEKSVPWQGKERKDEGEEEGRRREARGKVKEGLDGEVAAKKGGWPRGNKGKRGHKKGWSVGGPPTRALAQGRPCIQGCTPKCNAHSSKKGKILGKIGGKEGK